jgi:hypothetical protein
MRLPPRTLKNLGQLWITVDNYTGQLGDRFAQLVEGVRPQAVRESLIRQIGGKRTQQAPDDPFEKQSARYFLPCILTASIEAAAASGSR